MKHLRNYFLAGILVAAVFTSLRSEASLFNPDARFATSASNLGVGLGFHTNGLGLMGEYEYVFVQDFGVGATIRMYTGDDRYDVMSLGAFFKAHIPFRSWELFVAPGFNFARIDPDANNVDSETVLAPSFTIGTMMAVTDTVNFGVESTNMISPLNDDFRGLIFTDIMLKLQFVMR